jgi:hypothetical protein
MTTENTGAPEGTKEEALKVADTVDRKGRHAMRRAGQFVKEHPGVALAAVVGAGALIEVELAAGAALGIGAALLVLRGDRRDDVKEELRSWWRGGRPLAQGRGNSGETTATGAPPPAAPPQG